jgi:hypothetical protein
MVDTTHIQVKKIPKPNESRPFLGGVSDSIGINKFGKQHSIPSVGDALPSIPFEMMNSKFGKYVERVKSNSNKSAQNGSDDQNPDKNTTSCQKEFGNQQQTPVLNN